MLIVVFIWFIALCDVVLSTAICPDLCRCVHFETFCDNRRLHSIPNGISLETRNLSLNNNLIKSVAHPYNTSERRLKFLKVLDLRHNNITFLPDRSFIHFPKLSRLLLDHNKIAFPSDHNFPFDGIEFSLNVLSLSFNRITGLIADAHVFHLVYLTVFNASHNHISTISKDSLPRSITQLDLSFNPNFVLNSSSLDSLVHLNYLDLRGVQMEMFRQRLFRVVTNLTTLKIGGPNLFDIQSSAFIGLSNLTRLDIVNSNVNSFSDDLLMFCPNITRLNLTNNKLSALTSAFFSYVPNLTHLILAQNLLTDAASIASALHYLKLQELNLESNLVQNNFSNILNSQLHLKTLSLATNQLQDFDEILHSSSLQNLDISFNFISKINSDAFKNCSSLSNLYLAGNKLMKLPNTLKTVQSVNIFIDNNSWKCTCELFRSVKAEIDNTATSNLNFKCSVVESLSCMYCATPLHLKGRAIQNLTANQLDSCTEISLNGSSSLFLNVFIYVVVFAIVIVMGLACFIYIKKDSFSTFFKRGRSTNSGSTTSKLRPNYYNGSVVRPQVSIDNDVEISQQTDLIALSQAFDDETKRRVSKGSTSNQNPGICDAFCKECGGERPQTTEPASQKTITRVLEQHGSPTLSHADLLSSDTIFSCNSHTPKHNNNNTDSVQYVTIEHAPLEKVSFQSNPSLDTNTHRTQKV